jgi:CRISPR-associated protein Cas1
VKHTTNTLYITQPRSFLSKEGNTIVVEQDGNKVAQLPIHTVGEIVCFGFGIVVTAPLMEHCAENGVSIAYLSESGRFLGRVEGPIKGNVLLRRQQYRLADQPEAGLEIARTIVAAKAQNTRSNLTRFLRNYPGHDATEKVAGTSASLGRQLESIQRCSDIDILRGLEGESANSYFEVFDHLIVQQKDDFRFAGRNRRPPLDPVNAMLSFGYSLLANDLRSALESVGLDPYVGFLHTDRPGRPSLALDLMEEFRAPFVDRLVLNLINMKMVRPDQFLRLPTGEVQMDSDARKTLLTQYQQRKRESIVHPFLEEEMEIGLIFLAQARLLARHIRGDIDYYPAFLWR